MAISYFKSFRSTVTPFLRGDMLARLRLLVDPTTGAPVGIQNPHDMGPDGIFAPIDITAAQAANPTAAMLADLNATYRLNVAPYHRYYSNGQQLVGSDAGGTVQGPNGLFGTMIVWSPFIIDDPAGITIEGTVYVRSVPA